MGTWKNLKAHSCIRNYAVLSHQTVGTLFDTRSRFCTQSAHNLDSCDKIVTWSSLSQQSVDKVVEHYYMYHVTRL